MKEQMHEFVNQKKEMYRVNIANQLVQSEIASLDQKSVKRRQALQNSIKELNESRQDVVKLIEDRTTLRKELEAEEKMRKRKINETEDAIT